MRHLLTRSLAVAVLAVPLGACHSFLGIHFTRSTHTAERNRLAVAAATAATDAGRQRLADGQVGQAIESFQTALAGGEPVAPALNGLGVAYARLGRGDLAERYFQEAMAADPAEQRYADNLTRLLRSPSFALQSSAAIAAQAEKDSAALLAKARSEAAGSAQRPVIGKLQRVSRAEVHITTIAPQAAPLRSASARVDARFKPLVRVALAAQDSAQEPKDFKPLVRLEMPEASNGETAPAAQR